MHCKASPHGESEFMKLTAREDRTPARVLETSCKWEGPLDDVLNHLLTAHKTITTLGGEDIVFLATDIHLPGAVDWVMMQCCFDHYFMLVLEKQERHEGHQQFFAVVQLIGTEKEANAFR